MRRACWIIAAELAAGVVASSVTELRGLTAPPVDGSLDTYAVSKAVDSVKNNGPGSSSRCCPSMSGRLAYWSQARRWSGPGRTAESVHEAPCPANKG